MHLLSRFALLLLFSLLFLQTEKAYAQSTRSFFVEGAIGPGLLLSDDSGSLLGLSGSFGFRAKSFSLEGSVGDLLFRDAQVTTANLTFAEVAAQFFIPSTGKAEVFARASIGTGAFSDALTLESSTTLTSAFNLGLQYHLSPNHYVGLLLGARSVQFPEQTSAPLASGDVGLRFGYIF
jgi:hypothetical protein